MADFASAGFAQVTLLLSLAVVAGALTASLAAAWGAGQQAAALERLVENDAAVQSGFRRLLAAFDEQNDDSELRALAGAVPMTIGGASAQLGIEAEGSKIDVLSADPALIEGYLDLVLPAGSERSDLLANVRDARERQDAAAAIEALDAGLLAQLGVSDLRQDFTRFGGAGIDPQYASRRVLASVPDLPKAEAERIAALGLGQRAEYASASKYFVSGNCKFSLVARIVWTSGEFSEWRLPIEISTAGKAVVLAGPS